MHFISCDRLRKNALQEGHSVRHGTISAVRQMRRRNDEHLHAHGIPLVAVDLGVRGIDIRKRLRLQRIAKRNRRLVHISTTAPGNSNDARSLTATYPACKLASAPCTCSAPCE
jgi:hypothetical protein